MNNAQSEIVIYSRSRHDISLFHKIKSMEAHEKTMQLMEKLLIRNKSSEKNPEINTGKSKIF